MRDNGTNAPGVDLVRIVDVRDIVSMIDEARLWSDLYGGTLPKGGFVPSGSAVWIDLYFAPGTARYAAVIDRSNQGPICKHSLGLPIANDSPQHAQTIKMLTKGRWMALAMDANGQTRLVGSLSQPLKLKQGTFGTNPNGWNVELFSESATPAGYIEDWFNLYGNPADYSFDFSLQLNS